MNVWQEVKDRVLIEEVFAEYVQVLPSGRNFRCLSPFRQEKTPSLIISPDKKIWHDFGSGEGGDVFEFVAQIENISRFEALKKLAQKVGVSIKNSFEPNQDRLISRLSPQITSDNNEIDSQRELSKYDQGINMLQWSSDIYHKVLLKILQTRSHPITQYCIERGLSQEIVEIFDLGYAPKDSFLINLAKKHSLDTSLLYEVGLLKNIDNNTKNVSQVYKDKFSDRLMIPIKNSSGKVVGFTARVLPYDKVDRPKYLNSPQTDWFNKSRIWYGFHLNRKNLVQNRKAIIVEGNMDVIAAYRFGFNYALASQGTSFSPDQLKILKSYVDTLLMAFDNDEAGLVAGKKLFVEATKLGFVTQKVIIPQEYKDIDEYLVSLAKVFPSNQISSKLEVINYIDWVINKHSFSLGGDNTENQRKSILEIIELLSICDNITIEQYTARISKITGFNKTKLVGEVEKLKKKMQTSFASQQVLDTKEDSQINKVNYQIIQSWQLLVTFYLFYNDSGLNRDIMEHTYNLLQEFFSKLSQSGSFQEYININKEMFELIWENKQSEVSVSYISTLQKGIMLFLDQKVETFLFDQNKYLLYSKIKGFVV